MAGHSHDAPPEKTHAIYLALYVLGGLCIGTGLVNLYFSFGDPAGPLNSDFAHVGFTGLDNIVPLPPSDFAVPLVVIGILCMIYGNATAWKQTGGY